MDCNLYSINGNENARFLIPKVNSPVASGDNQLPQNQLAKQHAKLYVVAQLYPIEEATMKAKSDVASVMECFPAVSNHNILLAMAAWFATLCVVDNAVEKLRSDLAHLALTQAIQMLDCQDPDALPSTEERNAEGRVQRTGETRILAVVRAYKSCLHNLIPRAEQVNLRQASAKVFEAMLSECQWRQRGSIDETTYLSIRKETVGVRPLFLLAQYNFDPTSILNGQTQELDSKMSLIQIAIGMQNDLVGFERDVEEGETFNFILRLDEPSPQEREARWSKAVESHNDAIKIAITHWQNLKAGTDGGAQACADCLLKFVERHFLWASTSRRYRV